MSYLIIIDIVMLQMRLGIQILLNKSLHETIKKYLVKI